MYKVRSSRWRKNCMVLFGQKKPLTCIIFDTETTGTHPEKGDRVVEFAAQKFEISNGVMRQIDEINLYINPGFWMSDEVINIHHITNEFLADKPSEKEAFQTVKEFFGERPLVIGYNIEFDINMIVAMYKRQGEEFCSVPVGAVRGIDVLEMVRDITVTDDTYPNKSLQTVAEKLGLADGITFHNALEDVKATKRVLEYAYNYYITHPFVPGTCPIYPTKLSFRGYKRDEKGVYVSTVFNTPSNWKDKRIVSAAYKKRIYYSCMEKCWVSEEIDLSQYDIDALENFVLSFLNVTPAELGRFTEKKFGPARKVYEYAS